MVCVTAGITQTALASGPPSAPYATFLTPDHNWVDASAYSPDGKTVTVASINELFSSTGVTYKGGHTYLWNVAASRLAGVLRAPGTQQHVQSLAFNQAGTILAVGDRYGHASLWNAGWLGR
jgi:hypothetical protein